MRALACGKHWAEYGVERAFCGIGNVPGAYPIPALKAEKEDAVQCLVIQPPLPVDDSFFQRNARPIADELDGLHLNKGAKNGYTGLGTIVERCLEVHPLWIVVLQEQKSVLTPCANGFTFYV